MGCASELRWDGNVGEKIQGCSEVPTSTSFLKERKSVQSNEENQLRKPWREAWDSLMWDSSGLMADHGWWWSPNPMEIQGPHHPTSTSGSAFSIGRSPSNLDSPSSSFKTAEWHCSYWKFMEILVLQLGKPTCFGKAASGTSLAVKSS